MRGELVKKCMLNLSTGLPIHKIRDFLTITSPKTLNSSKITMDNDKNHTRTYQNGFQMPPKLVLVRWIASDNTEIYEIA